MPRLISSGRRSVLRPVSRRTSDVLPWSMCLRCRRSSLRGDARRRRPVRRRASPRRPPAACGSRATARRRDPAEHRHRQPAQPFAPVCSSQARGPARARRRVQRERRQAVDRQRAGADLAGAGLDAHHRNASPAKPCSSGSRRSAAARMSPPAGRAAPAPAAARRRRCPEAVECAASARAPPASFFEQRNARFSGCLLMRAIDALVPTTMPACGPPSSLSRRRR